ncbi:hypothetical protein [Tunturiibacter gelidoferens]|uniref:Transporter n=1 Tax=Tunturiibacter gelidiferens TaxID=3069689 RepID=A0A9X0U6C6_9BACT|nr:hypothetical protein [Edaphobacter lichenicola]MBB5331431.1 hypothetical protein [Edaphobacter lichenicola]
MPLGSRRWFARCSVLMFFGALLVFIGSAAAQGGPPFRTDDPETPGNRHWEINFGWIGDRNPGAGAYQVPDFDINYGLGDRIQLKYEIPIAIEETRPLGVSSGSPQAGQVIGGLGESLLGIKWRFYERYPTSPWIKGRFGTGLLGAFGHHETTAPAEASGDSPGEANSPEGKVSFSLSTYPQLFLDNPTRAVPRGVVAPGPNFFLPLEVNGRIGPIRYDGEVGYNFGNHALPQSWGRGLLIGHEFGDRTEAYLELYDQQDANRIGPGQGVGQFATGMSKQRQTTLGLGGRQALNRGKTLNLLLMGGRSFQSISPSNSQPSWIAYVGLQVLLGPKE